MSGLLSVGCTALIISLSCSAHASVHCATLSKNPTIARDAATASANTKVEQELKATTSEKQKLVTADAIAAVKETNNALNALEEKKTKVALAALERATGKLGILLARDPKIALAPIDVSALTINVVADFDTVIHLRDEASRLLDDGQVQAARHLLGGLASETVINVSNIPLATYPNAIKLTIKLIDAGKIEEAKKLLHATLDTVVITKTVIPIPMVIASELLKEAEKLAEKAGRNDEETRQLAVLLTDAREQLKFAQALGYGNKQDFKDLYAQLDDIESKTAGGKSGTGFFASIKQYLSKLTGQ